MKRLVMQKFVTVSSDVGSKTIITSCKYKELEKELQGQVAVDVTYPLGLKSKRVKQLKELGFKLDKVVYNGATEKHHSIREIWKRGEPL